MFKKYQSYRINVTLVNELNILLNKWLKQHKGVRLQKTEKQN